MVSMCLTCCLCKHKSKYHIKIIKLKSKTKYILKHVHPIEKVSCVRVKNFFSIEPKHREKCSVKLNTKDDVDKASNFEK